MKNTKKNTATEVSVNTVETETISAGFKAQEINIWLATATAEQLDKVQRLINSFGIKDIRKDFWKATSAVKAAQKIVNLAPDSNMAKLQLQEAEETMARLSAQLPPKREKKAKVEVVSEPEVVTEPSAE